MLAKLVINGTRSELVLNRPKARNALSLELIRALAECVNELRSHSEVSVVVVTGAGKAFCAGMDLKAVMDDPAGCKALLSELADLTIELRTLPMVSIAKINRAAIGGGCGLACVCDFAMTHADAKLGYPEVDLGLCPAVVAPWLVRRIGAGQARKVLLMGGLMTGSEAEKIGMVSGVAADLDELDLITDALAQRIMQGGPDALRATKALLNELDGSLDRQIVQRGAELSANVLTSENAQACLRERFAPRD